jgi:uncharacterized protein YraI
VLAVLLTPLASAFIASDSAVAQNAATAITTDALNMRTGASTGNPVILVIPYGATVTVRGNAQNGFLPIRYAGRDGWASNEYLAQSKPASTSGTNGTVTESLNLRSGPSGSSPVIVVMPAGAGLVITGTSSNGYLAVTWSGYQGFAHGDWIRRSGAAQPAPSQPTTPPAKGTAVTTDALNMRAGAGTTFTVLTVIPRGTTVSLTGQSANGFYGVTWSGKTGWASSDYLRVASGTAPAPTTPGPTPTPIPTKPPVTAPPVTSTKGTGITTDALNMRSGAATTNPVILVIPARSTVQLTGRSSGNFLEVTYNGRTGWAHKDWVTPQKTETRPTSSARVTETLNMRSGPATTYSVVTVLPAGATVVLTGQQSNGFHSVTWNGRTGWAFSTYLNITPPTAPQPTIPPTPVPTAVPPTPVPTAVPTQTAPIPTPNPVGVIAKPWPNITTNQGYHWTNTIEGPVRGTSTQAIAYAQNAGAVRMDEVEKYIKEIYRLGPQIGLDPSLLVAQSALETGNWKSYWWKERLNPAGLSINDDPKTHAGSPGFANGTVAARAQMAHMHAEVFGDRKPLPAELQGVDSSYEAVFQAGWAGDIVTLEDLGGTWATDTSYGFKIARVAAEIFG